MATDVKYMISSAFDQFSSQLNMAQRASSLFSEAPMIAGKILRRGSVIALNEAQYLLHKAKINALVKAGAITVKVEAVQGQVKVDVQTDPKSPLTVPTAQVDASAPNGPFAPGVIEDSVKLAEDVAKDVLTATVPEIPAAALDVVMPTVTQVDTVAVPADVTSKKASKKAKGA